jgi:hypothetical protein
MAWASRPLTGLSEFMAEVRTWISVESIATSRSELVTRRKCDWPEFREDPKLKEFDSVPVTEHDEIVGIFNRGTGKLMELSEAMFLASDDSLLSFVKDADQRKFAFLVRESHIAGLVTLSDIQKLPVYCVLFNLLMTVEMLVVDWIRAVCLDDPDRWLELLDDRAKARIDSCWRQAQKENVALDRLSCAGFADELNAALQLGLFPAERDIGASLKDLKNLRNMVCHGMDYALTPDSALKIPALVREALRIEDLVIHARKSQRQ